MISVSQAFSQSYFPSRDSLRRFVDRYIRNAAIDAFTNLRLNTALKGLLQFTDSASGSAYLSNNGIKKTGSTFQLGDYLNQHTTIKGASRTYDMIFDSLRNLTVTNAGKIQMSTSLQSLYLDDGTVGYSYIGKYPTGAYFYTGSNTGTTIMSLADLKSTQVVLNAADSSANIYGKKIRLSNTNGYQQIYLPQYLNNANKDSVLRVNASGQLEQFRVPDFGYTQKSGFNQLIWDKSANELQLKAIRVLVNGVAADTVVTDSTISYNVVTAGSGGASLGKIEFVADGNSATYQNDSLIGREIIDVAVQGVTIGSIVRSVFMYYDFDDATGTITFHNGYITEDDHVQILFGTTNLTAGTGVLETFTPGDIAGLLAWYDFSDESSMTFNTGRVSQANDLSGNGNDVVQATFANMPDFDAADGGNIYFTAARSADIKKTLGAAVTGNYTLYLLARKKSSETFVNSAEMFVTNSGTVTGLIEKTSTWGDGLWSGYDGTNSTNAVMFKSNDWQLLRVSFMQGNAVQFHINDEAPSRTFYQGPQAGSFPAINRYHFGRLAALGSDFSIKEAIAVADDADIATDKQVWNYMRAKHNLVSKPYLLMIGDSHTFGSQTGSGGTTGNPAYLVLTNALDWRVYNNGINGSKAYDPAAPTDPDDFHTIVDTWIANGNPATGWVAISYGTNDLAADIANPAWKTNFKADIQKFIDAGYDPQHIILWTPPYTTNPGYDDNVNDASVIIADIASEMGLRLADVRQAMITAGLDCYTVAGGDTIHGNDAIHAVIASTIQAQIY